MELPIERYRGEILSTISQNSVTIIAGETGCGKTRRVPRYLYEAGFNGDSRIGITEPRRIAAISAAEFVAGQIGCRIGEEVGFQIRFNDTTTEGTKVKFMTEGILLQEAKRDTLFLRYKIIVFDEVHERNLNTDFALGLVKRTLALRGDLKVAVMSATLEAEKFAKFFGGAPIVRVEGRMYPVETRYITPQDIEGAAALLSPKRGQEIEALAAYVVEKIHRSDVPGDILVFMTGEAEIHRVIQHLEGLNISGLKLLPIFGNMSPDQQRKIFERVDGRKVVVATNIAETSITVDGVVHVVDSGLIKESNFNPETGISTLKVVEHSKAGLEQRKGRAGRTQPGICWRLFTEKEYNNVRWNFRRNWNEEKRLEYTVPEIQRSDLAGVVLRLAGIGIKDVESFDYIDAPSFEMLKGAVKTLRAIGAITDDREVTEIGEKLLDLPLDPRIGRMTIEAKKFGCVEEITAIAAKLSVRNFFVRPGDNEDKADAAKIKFTDRRSDLLTVLAVIDAYEEHGWDRLWASENFLNWKAIEEAFSIRRQIQDILEHLGIELTSVGYHLPKNQYSLTEEEKRQGEMIGKAVLAGFIENLARIGSRHAYYRVSDAGGELYIHPSSVLFGSGDDARLIVSISIVETTKTFARDCQKVDAAWLQEAAPQAVKTERTEPQRSHYANTYTTYERVLFNGHVIDEKEMPATAEEIVEKIKRDRLTVADASTNAVRHVSSSIFLGIDAAMQETIDALSRKVEVVLLDPELYGYDGGFGINRKTYNKLSIKIDAVKSAYRYGDREEAKRLLASLEKELNGAFDKALEIQERRAKRAAAKEAQREQDNKTAAEREELKAAWQEYQLKLAKVQERCKTYQGWGIYTFPIGPDGLPQDYRGEDGKTYSFEVDYSEVLPERKISCWGYVTQWGRDGYPSKVALVLEVMAKPKEA